METTNRAFQQMYLAACRMLADQDPCEIAEKAAVSFDGGHFTIPSLGSRLTLSYPDYACPHMAPDWHHLTVLHYLHLADGTPLSGQPIPLAQMPSGMVRGGGFDRSSAAQLSSLLQNRSESQIRSRLAALGAQILPGKADLCAVIPYLPRFPVYLNIWFADEEFPPSGRLLVDGTAGHYLTIEDAVAVGEVILDLLK